ncbi:MAG: very short patch repair endonuclease [Gammaproteobacteria bacterium]
MKSGLSIRSRAPKASSQLVRRVMQANTGKTTEPERKLRSIVHRMGLRFRADARPDPSLRCKADLVFRRCKVCVFVDGCYWHGCAVHFAVPRQNGPWWAEKIADNRSRDMKRTSELEALGWTVIRLWEHDLLGERAGVAAARVVRTVRRESQKPVPTRVRTKR